MPVLDVGQIAGSDDAEVKLDGSSYTSTGTTLGLWSHLDAAFATAVGWRFKIPTTITAAQITDVRLVLQWNANSGAQTGSVVVEPTIAAAWANTTTNRPINRYNTATITNGATPQTWTFAATNNSNGSTISPDLSTQVKALMGVGTAGTDYIGICLKMGSGQNTISSVPSQEQGSVGARPVLRITHTVASTSQVTTNGVSYNINGTGNRYMNLILRNGDSVGGKVMVYLHGGSFQTTKNYNTDPPSASLLSLAHSLGYDVINAEYSLSTANVATQVGNSFPEPVHDIHNLILWINRWASNYGWDTSKVVFVGHSAGGHVALFSLIALANTSNYTGYQNVASNRKAAGVTSRSAFDFDNNLGATSFTPKGCFVMGAPTSILLCSQQSDPSGAVHRTTRNTYMGEVSGTNPSSSYRELDLDGYIDNTANATYGTTTHEPTFPIGYVEATDDQVVFAASGVNSLHTALGTTGFTYARPAVGTVTATGLSRWQTVAGTADPHTQLRQDSNMLSAFTAWDAALFPAAPSATANMLLMF